MAVPLYLDDITSIPEELPPHIAIRERLSSSGQHSKLYIATIRGVTGYIAKLIPIDSDGPQGCYTYRQLVRNELLISQRMSDLGIGPKVHAIAITRYEGYIVMDQYQGNLGELILQTQTNLAIDHILITLQELIGQMHSEGIAHRDLIPTNVLYQGNTIVIADYGLAIESNLESVREDDWEFFRAIVAVIHRIRAGERFRSVRALLQAASPNVEPLTFIWDGNECPDWQ